MNEQSERPFDVGLQAERTALAWQRTSLSFGIAALVGARLLTNVFSTASFVIGAVGIIMMVLIFAVGHRRYRTNHTRLTAAGSTRVPLANATPLMIYAAATLALSLFGLVLILFGDDYIGGLEGATVPGGGMYSGGWSKTTLEKE